MLGGRGCFRKGLGVLINQVSPGHDQVALYRLKMTMVVLLA